MDVKRHETFVQKHLARVLYLYFQFIPLAFVLRLQNGHVRHFC